MTGPELGLHCRHDWVAWLVVPAVLLWRWCRARAAVPVPYSALAMFAEPVRHRLAASPALRWRCLPAACELLALWLGLLALAQPILREPLPPERLGLDVMLCLDCSSSMQVADLDGAHSRLQVATAVAAEFARARPDDRIGLLAFARYPDLRCPPTLDHEALAELLAGLVLVPADSDEDATGIGGAVALAAQVLARSEAKGKVVVLLTDGEENVATANTPQEIAPVHAAQWCRRLGVRVHGIVTGQGHVRADGQVVPLDTTAVQQLAVGSGGRFHRATSAQALKEVYATIAALETVPFAAPKLRTRELFAWPLLLAALSALVGRWLRARGLGVWP
ncbi:MAG: VWA domain-containing protein [Planctomycetes bacterium]|nr:VWA domain-containing protein [Planctomycetota bacterium]